MSLAANLLLRNRIVVDTFVDGQHFTGQPMRTHEINFMEDNAPRSAVLFARIIGPEKDSNAFESEYINMQYTLKKLFQQNARWDR